MNRLEYFHGWFIYKFGYYVGVKSNVIDQNEFITVSTNCRMFGNIPVPQKNWLPGVSYDIYFPFQMLTEKD